MTTETAAPVTTASTTSPIVTDTQTTVTSPVVEPQATPDSAPAPDAAADSVAAPNPNETPEWAQKRINELTAKRYEAERDAKAEKSARIAAEQKAKDLLEQISKSSPSPSPAPTTQQMTDEEIERRAQVKAQEMAAAARFNDACNTIVSEGKKEYKDWDEVVRNLGLVGAVGKDASPEFLENAIELKDPHKILHHLGKNLEEAERITKMSPKRMAMELARIEAQLNAPAVAPAPAPVSQAPAPVIPVGGKAAPGPKSLDDPNLSTEEFMALRAQQADDRRKRYLRV